VASGRALDEWPDVGEPESDDKGRRVEDNKQQTAKERKRRRGHATKVSISLQLGSGAEPKHDAQQAKNDRDDRESVEKYANTQSDDSENSRTRVLAPNADRIVDIRHAVQHIASIQGEDGGIDSDDDRPTEVIELGDRA
jgi:hypothetical protein